MRSLVFTDMTSTGGTGTFIKNLLSIHFQNNIKTTLCCDIFDLNESMQKTISQTNTQFIIIKKRSKPFNKSYFSLLFEWIYYFPIIKKNKSDLVIISTANPGWCFFFFFLKVPFIYILHTPVNKPTFKSKLMFLIPKYFSNKYKMFYAVSKYVKNSIIENWNVDERIVNIIYNSYTTYYKTESNLVYKNQNKIILTLGHVVEYKNPFFWIDIAEKITELCKDAEFYWLGEGDLLIKCQEQTKNNTRIHFIGHIDNVEEYYKNAYLYLQPSIKESLGMSVIDAMHFSLPCIVSEAEGLPETVENNKSGFVIDITNKQEYIKKIIYLLENSEIASDFGLNAYNRSIDIFNPMLQKTKILSLYQKALFNY